MQSTVYARTFTLICFLFPHPTTISCVVRLEYMYCIFVSDAVERGAELCFLGDWFCIVYRHATVDVELMNASVFACFNQARETLRGLNPRDILALQLLLSNKEAHPRSHRSRNNHRQPILRSYLRHLLHPPHHHHHRRHHR